MFIVFDLILFSLVFIDTSDQNFKVTFISLFSFFVIIEILIFIIGLKVFVSKIEVTSKGLRWKLFKKELKIITWEDIISIKKGYIAGTQSLNISLKSGEMFSFNVNKKILKSIIISCNNKSLIEKMEEIKLVF